jgi:hypothetical protein
VENVPAAVVGSDCADFLGTGVASKAVNDLAIQVGIAENRLRYELFALEVFSTEVGLLSLIDDEDVRNRTVAAFFDRLATQERSWADEFDTIADRHAAYVEAFNNPHPELGPGFRIGQCFAAGCEHDNDVRLINFAASIYSSTVTGLGTLLASVEVA